LVSGGNCGEPSLGCAGGVAGVQGHRGGGAAGPGGGERQPHGRGSGLGAVGRAPGLAGAVEGQPAPGEQLEAVRSPAGRNEGQLLTTGTAEEQLGGTAGLPALEQDVGEPRRGPGCDETFIKVMREFDALPRGGERDVQIAGGDPSKRPASMAPSRSSVASASLPRTYQTLGRTG